GSRNNIPWVTAVKLFGTYPLPYGVNVSGGLQSLPSALGTSPLQYGVFTAGTGFTQPNGIGTFWQVARATKYAAGCLGGCPGGATVIPNLTPATTNIPVVAPGTEFTPRYNQIDFGASKTFRFGHTSVMPRLDL